MVVVQPEAGKAVAGSFGLGDFAVVVGKLEVDPAPVNIETFAQILEAHDRALEVPARKTFPPRAFPAHQMLGLGFFPKCPVARVFLFFPDRDPGAAD